MSMPPTDGDLAISRGGLTVRAAPNATAMESFSHQKNYLMAISSTRKWSVAWGGIGPPGVPRSP